MIARQSGDVLLYAPKGIFGRIIALKTWHPIAHVEVAIDELKSVASRDGRGVSVYPFRASELSYVLRPRVPFSETRALAWFFKEANGKPYGWSDLANFIGLPVNKGGMFCSEFVTLYLRAGGVHVFEDEPAEKIAPFEFLVSELFTTMWSRDVEPDRAVAG